MTYSPAIDVLIVAHDSTLTEALLRAVRTHELSTDVAAEPVEAKRLLSRHDYRALVLDLDLDNEAAFDVLEFIRAENLKTANVIVVTGSDPSRVARLDGQAIKAVIPKPVDAKQLAGYIRELV